MTELSRRRLLQAGTAALALPGLASAAPALPLPRPVAWPQAVPLLDGRVLAGAALAARPAVVVFWSSTCPFCRNHNRHVQKLQQAAAGTDLLVLGVSIDDDAGVAAAHARHEGYSFPITMAAQPLAAMLDTRRVIPRTYGIERGARLVTALPGEMFEEDVMELLRLARGA